MKIGWFITTKILLGYMEHENVHEKKRTSQMFLFMDIFHVPNVMDCNTPLITTCSSTGCNWEHSVPKETKMTDWHTHWTYCYFEMRCWWEGFGPPIWWSSLPKTSFRRKSGPPYAHLDQYWGPIVEVHLSCPTVQSRQNSTYSFHLWLYLGICMA